jgi:two-component system nitrate/nitrite response regulator NarL
VRIVVVDDDTVIREGLAVLLRPDQVVAAYSTVEGLLAERPDADIVLLDLDLRAGNPVGAIGELEPELALLGLRSEDLGLQPSATGRDPLIGAAAVRAAADAGYRVLIYTNLRNRLVLAACLGAGAAGVMHKVDSVAATRVAIREAVAGRIVLTESRIGLAQVVVRRGELPELGPRQRQVLNGRARGDTYRRIGRDLGISEKTAQEYMEEVNRKFAQSLRRYSPADLQRLLGLGPANFASGGGSGRS